MYGSLMPFFSFRFFFHSISFFSFSLVKNLQGQLIARMKIFNRSLKVLKCCGYCLHLLYSWYVLVFSLLTLLLLFLVKEAVNQSQITQPRTG